MQQQPLQTTEAMRFLQRAQDIMVETQRVDFDTLFPYAEWLPANFYLMSVNSKMLGCNRATTLALGGLHIQDLVGRDIFDAAVRMNWPTAYAESAYQHDQMALTKGTAQGHEFSIENGIKKTWLSQKQAIYNADGAVIAICGLTILLATELRSPISWDPRAKKILIQLTTSETVAFSLRQFLVLKSLLKGETAAEISKHLLISSKTVESYVNQIKEKLQCSKQRHILAYFIERDMVKKMMDFDIQALDSSF